jgi:hypothetical protein
MFEKTFVKRTGQFPTLLFGLALIMGGFALILVCATGNIQTSDRFFPLLLGGFGLSAAGMAWLLLRIRCPKCGARLVWIAATGQNASNWFSGLLAATKCPACGAAADDL